METIHGDRKTIGVSTPPSSSAASAIVIRNADPRYDGNAVEHQYKFLKRKEFASHLCYVCKRKEVDTFPFLSTTPLLARVTNS